MTAQYKTTIKSYFQTGDKPNQAQFIDLIDSYLDVSAATNGTVTSAGLIMPNMFNVTGSPITSAGNFTVTMSAQAQRTVFAAPVSALGVPVFRTLIGSDIPDASLASAKLISTAVSAGSYTNANLTVNAQGQVTAAANGSSSAVIQQTRAQVQTVVTGSTSIPFDNTIPQITEGDEYLTVNITPTNAASVLVIQVNFWGHCANSLTVALFKTGTSNALAAVGKIPANASNADTYCFTHYISAGSTSAQTFTVRAGGASTTTMNGISSTQYYGGAASSSITVTEYSV